MPSFPHEILVDFARKRSEVIRKLLQHCGDVALREDLEHAIGEPRSSDLSQVVPIEYLADNVTLFRDDAGEHLLVAVVEVQEHVDPNKQWTWPVYSTVARATFHCPCVLMVIAMEPRIARWARAILDNLCADVYFHFVVISSADVPHIIDPAKAKETPELAVLSAIAYPTLEVAQAALAGIEGLPDDRAHLYYDVILNGLSEATRNQLESTVQQYPYRSDFARKNYALGEASGHEKGLEEGREAGRLALQTAALELARTRLERLSAEQEAAIRSFVDESALAALIIALGTTSTPEQARAVLAQPAR
jgi:hypothetical protein